MSLQRNTGRAVSSDFVQPDAGHLVQADSTVRYRLDDRTVPVSVVQDQRAARSAVHHRALHQLRADRPAEHRRGRRALDQARHGAALPARRLSLSRAMFHKDRTHDEHDKAVVSSLETVSCLKAASRQFFPCLARFWSWGLMF